MGMESCDNFQRDTGKMMDLMGASVSSNLGSVNNVPLNPQKHKSWLSGICTCTWLATRV